MKSGYPEVVLDVCGAEIISALSVGWNGMNVIRPNEVDLVLTRPRLPRRTGWRLPPVKSDVNTMVVYQ